MSPEPVTDTTLRMLLTEKEKCTKCSHTIMMILIFNWMFKTYRENRMGKHV